MGGPPVHLQSGDHGALRTPTVAPFSRSQSPQKAPVWGQRGVEVGRGLEDPVCVQVPRILNQTFHLVHFQVAVMGLEVTNSTSQGGKRVRNRAESRCAFFLVGAMALGVLLDLVRGPHELLCLIILDLLDLRKGDLSALEDFHLAEILQCQLPDCIHGGGGGGGGGSFSLHVWTCTAWHTTS